MRNLHLYGCWWFCNNPSIIAEMTAMRLEMMGTYANVLYQHNILDVVLLLHKYFVSLVLHQ